MKQEVRAKLTGVRRVSVSGIGNVGNFDDNVIRLKVKVNEGPSGFIDRLVTIDMGISDFVGQLHPSVAQQLRDELECFFKETSD